MEKTMTLLNAMLIEVIKKYPDADINLCPYDGIELSDICVIDDGKSCFIVMTDNIYSFIRDLCKDRRQDTIIFAGDANYQAYSYDKFVNDFCK